MHGGLATIIANKILHIMSHHAIIQFELHKSIVNNTKLS